MMLEGQARTLLDLRACINQPPKELFEPGGLSWPFPRTENVITKRQAGRCVVFLGSLLVFFGGRLLKGAPQLSACVVWCGMVEVCEDAPVAVSGWVLAYRHDRRPCAASRLHRGTISVSNIIGGHGNTRHRVGMKPFGLGPTSSPGGTRSIFYQ